MRLLVFATHKDDEALIGGGLLQQSTNSLVIASCKSNKFRDDVYKHNAKKFGYETKCFDFDDCSLFANIDNIADKMLYEIKRFRPTHILGNHWQDLHQDHIANARAMEIAVRPTSEYTRGATVLYGYGVSLYETSELHRKPNCYIELTKKEVENKAMMLEHYDTELRHNRNAEAVITNARMSGMMFGTKYAEMYYQSSGEILV